MRVARIAFAVLLICLFSTQVPRLVEAAQPQDVATPLSKQEFEALAEQARQKGVQIIVVAPTEDKEGTPKPKQAGAARTMIASLRSEARLLLAEAPDAPARIWSALLAESPDGTFGHYLLVVLVMAAIMVVTGFGERIYGNWLKFKMRAVWPEALEHMPEKMCFLLTRFMGRLAGFAVFGLVAIAAAALVFEENQATEDLVLYLVFGVVGVRAVVEFWRVWISPNLSEFRLPSLADEDAKRLFRWLATAAIVSGTLLCLGLWLETLGADGSAVILVQLALLAVILLVNLVAIAATRTIVAGLIIGPTGAAGRGNHLRGLLGSNWHLLLGLYLLVAWFATSSRVMLGQPDAPGPSFGMVAVLAGTLTLYSMAVVFLDWLFYRRKGAPNRKSGAEETKLRAIETEEGEAPKDGWFSGVRSFEDLAKQSVELLLIMVAIGGLLLVWGVDITNENSPFVRLWDVIFVLFAGYVAMQSTRIWIERKIDEEGGFEEPEPGEEGAAGGVSRLATLLPLFRNFILATIVVIAVMIGLSELGINIAPLFAGAGVIGLAIGFGAQTLIRDIFSGAFFLVDDAFRRGEYIDIGDVKGTVERISVRSMQVRHHNGPLHTVPFGEIKYLTNYSRDWVMMKLKLRVTYDTDVTKVRKLIKQLGQELLEHPEIGEKFLQPLKSQGVLAMEDSAMIIRVKFMTKPGDQFITRKAVYAAIQELFAREGIKFAHREVTVRIAKDEASQRPAPDDDRKRAVAGAVAPVLEEEAAPADGGDDR